MKEEVTSAVYFLAEYLTSQSGVIQEQIELFRDNLAFLITERFQSHWHPSKPLKGNAYRCLNVDSTTVDPVIVKASCASGISPTLFQELFPEGLALWIDPRDVSYRIGKRPTNIRSIYGHSDEVNYTTNPFHCSPRQNSKFYNNHNNYHWNSPQQYNAYMQTTQVY